MKYFSIWLIVSLTATGCERPAAALAAPVLSRAEQCLNSFKLQLKDPDSAAVVADLGLRDFKGYEFTEGFFVRYKAKNSFGAYVSSNALCEKRISGYERSEIGEDIVLKHTANVCLDGVIAAMRDGRRKNNLDCDKVSAQLVYDMTDSLRVMEHIQH